MHIFSDNGYGKSMEITWDNFQRLHVSLSFHTLREGSVLPNPLNDGIESFTLVETSPYPKHTLKTHQSPIPDMPPNGKTFGNIPTCTVGELENSIFMFRLG